MSARLATKKQAVDDIRRLSGPEKAAVILLSLGEDHTRLWQGLDDDEIKEISQAMASLGTVQTDDGPVTLNGLSTLLTTDPEAAQACFAETVEFLRDTLG